MRGAQSLLTNDMRMLPQIIEDMFCPVVNDATEEKLSILQIKLDKTMPISKCEE